MIKINKLIYLLLLGLFIIPQAQAEQWVDISNRVEITKSRRAFDRVHRVLFSYVTVKNITNESLTKSVRIVITNPSIPVSNKVGMTKAGDAYLQMAENLAAGAMTKVRVDFELTRVPLNFGISLQTPAESCQPSCNVPQNLNAKAATGAIDLTWDTVANATGYTLYYSIDSNFPSGSTEKKENVQSPYRLTGLTNGNTYYLALTSEVNAVESNFSNEVSAIPASRGAAKPLNDTGITWGGDYPSGNSSTCAGTAISAQDCSSGRDATHNDDSDGHAGFSFTKLDANGGELPASANNWRCVRDNVTGLIWEAKTDDGSIHDKDNRYRWGGLTALGSGTVGSYYNDWNTLVNGSNAESLCGYADWRVPSTDELLSLVDHSRFGMAIDSDYFPYTAFNVWSSSPSAYFTNGAWYVYFYNGYAGSNYRNSAWQVRLVRSGQ